MIRWLSLFLLLAVSTQAAFAQPAKRRVYVLHSGMHIILAPNEKNQAARVLREELLKRGVADADLVALDSPFPMATFSDPVPREGLLIYLGSADPASRPSQDAYLRLHKVLQERKITGDDRIVWVGHSAGGQMGMTMAHLAHNLQKFPELAKKTLPYRFDTVITLGSAVGANTVPAEVKLRHYYSSADTMIMMLSKHGDIVSESVGIKFRFSPFHDLRANAGLRVFHGIEHGNWYTEPRVLESILREPDYCPAWRTPANVGRGVGLAQLLARAVESAWHISIEEP